MVTIAPARLEAPISRLLGGRNGATTATADVTPWQVAVIYATLAFAALYFSDVYLPRAIEDPAVLSQAQAVKGGVEVVLTAGLIFLLTRRSRLALARQNERLEHLQAERSILHRVLRHNLRQDLNLIRGNAELVRSAVDDGTYAHEFGVIERATDRIERYATKASRYERLLNPSFSLEVIDLAALVAADGMLDDVRAADDVDLTVDSPAETLVIGHSYIRTALHELVENAIRHNDADRPAVDVTVGPGPPGLHELVVADDGPGLPEMERQAIDRMEDLPLTHSGGLGLWFAKLACTVGGGDLAIRESAAGGTAVALQLPEASDRSLSRTLSTAWPGTTPG